MDHLDHSKEKQETNDKILKENQRKLSKDKTNWNL
jgi:hypothetical protein